MQPVYEDDKSVQKI